MRVESGFRDIVNRATVNLTNCEHEPIHIPGSIQQQGFLLGLKPASEARLLIDYCSENCSDFIPFRYDELLGKTFSGIFGEVQAQAIQKCLNQPGNGTVFQIELELSGRPFYCSLHQSADVLVLEAEPVTTTETNTISIQHQTQQLLSYMSQLDTLQQLCDRIARDTRQITGYDRVMIYRFDEQYNGEIFAESKREDLESFFGLHYPHTDIPVQARQLYIKNLLRIITDVHYTPSPIYTVNDSPDKNLDLSMALLRSSSPIHMQYLINMGVGATLTISLVHNNRLWGLIACHHYAPKNSTPEIRLLAQLQGHFITSQIEIREIQENYALSAQVNLALQQLLVRRFSLEKSSIQDIAEAPELLKICNASGVAIFLNGGLYVHGVTPEKEDIQALFSGLSSHSAGQAFHSNSLQENFPNIKTACEQVSGCAYHPLNQGQDGIIWFRQETITEVNWAGEPAKSIVKDEKGLSPRKSFERWKEIVQCTSKKWLKSELEAAANFAQNLQKHWSAVMLAEEEKKYRLLNEILNETNLELENINWISTHDLQEPLRKIQLYASRILVKNSDHVKDEVLRSLEKISYSADRMRTLINDILVYNKLRKTEVVFEPIHLNALLKAILEDHADIVEEKNAIINVGDLPELKGISFMIRQLFVNLIYNSLKFSVPGRAPLINIYVEYNTTLPGASGVFNTIVIEDNGIGFEQKYSDSIFIIFKRLHSASEFPGSGIGLSLSKKVMQSHGGDIRAEGVPDQGATFRLYFPQNPEP